MKTQKLTLSNYRLGRLVALAALALTLIFLIALLPAVSNASTAQVSKTQPQSPQSGEPGTWSKYGGNPVLTPTQAWEGTAVWAAYVTKDSSTFKMWYGGVDAIGYAASTDGITWVKSPDNPVLIPGSPGAWDEAQVGEPFVIIESGVYKMWYWGRRADDIKQIGYATSSDGISWTKYAGNPVVTVGGPGSWDELEAGTPSVLYQDGTYKMWYTGQDSALRYAIGYATSSDGINWTKYGSNPILVGTAGTWDEGGVLASKIYFDGATYRMWYFGKDSILGTSRIGYATSPDGVTWTKHSGNPVLDLGPSGAWDDQHVAFPSVLLDDGIYKMWYNGNNGLVSQTGYATAPTITWSDNFDGPPLNSRWSWIHEDPTHWSLTARPGFLRITTQPPVHNLLVQNAPVGDYEIQTRVNFTPTQNFQIAGLLSYQDDDNWLTLGRAFCDTPPPNCVGNGIYFDRVEGGQLIGSNYAMTTTVQGDAYLRLIRHTNVYTGYVSIDGTNWTLVGVHTLTIAPTKIGLRASNQSQGAAEIPADFDFFQLIDDSRYVFLPLIVKYGGQYAGEIRIMSVQP